MLNIRMQKLGQAIILHCVGRVTFPYTEILRSLALHETHASCLILDLANVTSIDAAGLGMLIALRSWSEASGRALKLMNVGPKVQRVLELTNLESVFKVCSAWEMLDLLCRALHDTETASFVTPLQDLSCAHEMLSAA